MDVHAMDEFPRTAKSAAQRKRKSYRTELNRESQQAKRYATNRVRRFIAWDGEGINTKGPNRPQAYVLFGNSTGSYITRRDGSTLSFTDCAEIILATKRANPNAWHVGFAFDYDVNQIIRTLPYGHLETLNKNGQVKYGPYFINWRKGKSFTITKHTDDSKTTVTIYDIFSFFATSFIKSVKAILGKDTEHSDAVDFVSRGKDRRKDFSLSELDSEVIPYWSEEIRLLEILICRFRDLLYDANFPITKWYGPGAIASLVLNRVGIKSHMDRQLPVDIIEASQYAYAGGRFERFRAGRYVGDVWAIDINSAYPDALARLPSLANGTWIYRSIEKTVSELDRDSIRSFAIYHVYLSHPEWRFPWYPNTPPGPLFFRTDKGEMRYPWNVEGWYWGPEIENLCHPRIAEHAYVYGAWEYVSEDTTKPFGFIPDMYEQRREWKREGRAEQLALKLAMNSIYGKLAQRIGWEQSGMAPTFHQLEWAGWVTSYVRARLFRALWKLGNEIVSVETDGIYTTRDPATIGITDSGNIGEWSVSKYAEILYLQSGTYFARTGNEWISKYRGLDPQSLPRDAAERYLQDITPGVHWPSLHGSTTRYIGLAAAMIQSSGNPAKFRGRHGVWEQEKDKDIAPDRGKRSHHIDSCVECAEGISPYDYPHYFGITIDLLPDGVNTSTKHHLPWKDSPETRPAWRDELDREAGKLFASG